MPSSVYMSRTPFSKIQQLGPTIPKEMKYNLHFVFQFIRRNGQPEEIGKACLFLATDATYTTGHNVHCSGGGELDYGFKADMAVYINQ